MGGMRLGAAQLRRELTILGSPRVAVVLVHCSARAIGWVEHIELLRDVLLDVLGVNGTLVVPTQSASKSRTSAAFQEAVAGLSESEREGHLESVPGFDRATTPSERMGALAEAVRTSRMAFRSAHPTTSFAAIGRYAAKHPHDCLLGMRSPLGWMYRTDTAVLLLGVGYNRCTAFHLGEASTFHAMRSYCFKIGGCWRQSHSEDSRDSDFAELGARFEATHPDEIRPGFIGEAPCRLFPLRAAADFAARWLPTLRFSC